MRVAYADPPYPGCAGYYPEQEEVDPVGLVTRLQIEFPDGWAFSTKTNALREVLPSCPSSVRVCAWVKGWASYKPGIHPAYAWEPLLISGGRKPPRSEDTVRDWLKCHPLTGVGFIGAKPPAFCIWVFRLLGLRADDELVDIFPGSGAVSRAWQAWAQQPTLQVVP